VGRRSVAREQGAADLARTDPFGRGEQRPGDDHGRAKGGARGEGQGRGGKGEGASERDPQTVPESGGGRVEVVAIFGPTASGKSAVAEAVAAILATEVVSVDALQVYRGLPILTNQPATQTRLVAVRTPAEQMTVGEFAPLAHAEIDGLVGEHGVAVVTGGTGLYLRAALADLGLPPAVAEETVARVAGAVEADAAAAHVRLASLDPAAAAAVHPNDTQRLVRALSLAESGRSLARDDDRLWSRETRRPSTVVGLELSPEELDRRIVERARAMFEAGVVAEVRTALEQPLSRTVEKTLGLREIASLPAEEAFERLVARTRRYARYQRKWMRRIPGIVLVDGERAPEVVAAEVVMLAELAAG
jgi:tRNA dimethylallyltransferase